MMAQAQRKVLRGRSDMRVLIADDSAVVRERLAYLLGDLDGIEVVGQAACAADARTLAARLKPDLAILDMRAPAGSGADLVSELKRSNPGSKVMMLTNFVDPENKKSCIDRGADYFFDKSIEFEEAVAVLRGMAQRER
jgi:DNA-binding NarL/FixJ family response regulator